MLTNRTRKIVPDGPTGLVAFLSEILIACADRSELDRAWERFVITAFALRVAMIQNRTQGAVHDECADEAAEEAAILTRLILRTTGQPPDPRSEEPALREEFLRERLVVARLLEATSARNAVRFITLEEVCKAYLPLPIRAAA